MFPFEEGSGLFLRGLGLFTLINSCLFPMEVGDSGLSGCGYCFVGNVTIVRRSGCRRILMASEIDPRGRKIEVLTGRGDRELVAWRWRQTKVTAPVR